MQADEGPAFGAAILAGVGAGVYNNITEAVNELVAVGENIRPDADRAEQYAEIYPIFTSLYNSLKEDYAKSFEITNKT